MPSDSHRMIDRDTSYMVNHFPYHAISQGTICRDIVSMSRFRGLISRYRIPSIFSRYRTLLIIVLPQVPNAFLVTGVISSYTIRPQLLYSYVRIRTKCIKPHYFVLQTLACVGIGSIRTFKSSFRDTATNGATVVFVRVCAPVGVPS